MSSLALELPDELVERIAHRAAKLLAEQTSASERWMSVEEAAAHLGISTSHLYTLCSARRVNGIPVVKEGARSYFKATELDRWRENGGHR